MMPQPEILKDKMPSCYSRCSACAWEYDEFHSPIWITAFRNGDKHHYGTRFLVSPARQRNFEGLLDSLTKRLEPSFGAVRQVYSPCSGNPVKCLKDLKPNHKYVAAGKESLRKISNGYLTYDEKFKKRHKCNHKTGEIYRPDKGKSLKERYSNIQSKYLEDAERRRKGTITIFVHKNKDFDNRPVRFVLSEKDRTSLYWWGPTMQSIASKLQMPSIKGFFTINGGAIHIPCHLQHGEMYVAVSKMEKFQKGPYKRADVIPNKFYHNNNCLGQLSICSSDFESKELESSSEEEEGKDETSGGNIFRISLIKQSHFKETEKENNDTEKSGQKEGKIEPTYVRISHHFIKEENGRQEHKCSDLEYVPAASHQCQRSHEDMPAFDNKKDIKQEDDLEKCCEDIEKEVISNSKHIFDCLPLCRTSSTSTIPNDENIDVNYTHNKSGCEGLPQTVEMNHSEEPDDEPENNISEEKHPDGVIKEQENEIPCEIEEIVAHSCHGLINPKTGTSHHSTLHYSTTIIFQKENESDELSHENIPSEELSLSHDPSSGLKENSESQDVAPFCDCYPEESTVLNHTKNTKMEEIHIKVKSQADNECQTSEVVTLTKIILSPSQTSCPQTQMIQTDESPVGQKDAIIENSQRVKTRAEEKEIQTEIDSEVPCCDCYPEESMVLNKPKKEKINKNVKSQADNECQTSEMVTLTKIIVSPSQTSCLQTQMIQTDESPMDQKDAIIETSQTVNTRAEEKEIQTEIDSEVSKETYRKKKSRRSCCACFPLCRKKGSSVGVKNASTETLHETAKKSSYKEAEMQTDSESEVLSDRKRKRRSKSSCCTCSPLCRRKDSSVYDKNTSTGVDTSDETAKKLSYKEAEMQTDSEYEELNERKRKKKSRRSCCACFPLCRKKGSSVGVKNASTETLHETAKKSSYKEEEIQTDSESEVLSDRKRKRRSKCSCCTCLPLCRRRDSSATNRNANKEAHTSDETARKLNRKEAEMQTDSEYEELNERKKKRKSRRSCCACFPLCRKKNSPVGVKNASTETDALHETAKKSSYKGEEMQTDSESKRSKKVKRKRKCKSSCCACLPLCRRKDSSISVRNASTEANLMGYPNKNAKKINIMEAESQTDDIDYVSSPEQDVKFKDEQVGTECSSDEEYMPDEKTVSWYALQNEKIHMRKAKGINNIIVSYTYKETPESHSLYSPSQEARKKDNNKFLKMDKKQSTSGKKMCNKSHARKNKRGKITFCPCSRWSWCKKQKPSLTKSEPSFLVPYNIGYEKSSGLNNLIFENPQLSSDRPMNEISVTDSIKNYPNGEKKKEKIDVKKETPIPSVRRPARRNQDQPKNSQKKSGNKIHPPTKRTQGNIDKIEEEYLKEKFEPYSGDESN